jgi:hypothetical protein
MESPMTAMKIIVINCEDEILVKNIFSIIWGAKVE